MNTFQLLLLVAFMVAHVVTSNTLRGSVQVIEQEQSDQSSKSQSQSRRHGQLVQGMTCKLLVKDTAYGPTEEHPNGYSQEEWVCELSQEESSRLGLGGIQYLDIVDDASSSVVVANAISGQSTVIISEAIVDILEGETKMYIPHDAIFQVVRTKPDEETETRRNLANSGPAKTGTLTTLVIRIIDAQGVAPNPSVAQLENDVFDDAVSLKTQYDACSYGKLQIEPFRGVIGSIRKQITVSNGVVDVQVNDFYTATNNNRGALQTAAFKAANEQLGGDLSTNSNNSKFDLVMFCFPPGTGDWLAYAFAGRKFSFYNNEWCSSVSAQLHEVGHNLGLAHSGENEPGENLTPKYSDQSGMMGSSYSDDDTSMCFNPAKNYQLGWYDDKVQTIDPLVSEDNNDNAMRLFTLNGVSDYDYDYDNDKNALIVLRLEQTASLGQLLPDYYIGYNRKDGINKDTKEDPNMVTIVRKEGNAVGPKEYGQSMKVGKLSLGQSYTIENFNNEDGRDVEIKFIGMLDGRDATIEVIDVKNYNEHEHAPEEDKDESSCALYEIELKTDRYPGDNSWTISEDGGIGRVIAMSPVYTDKEAIYTTPVCLSYNTNYKFVIVDKYKDGLCCGQGEGSYRGLDGDTNELFKGGANFEFEEQAIRVGDNPNSPRPPPPTGSGSGDEQEQQPECKDRKGKFRFKKNSKKKTCNWIAKKGKCNKEFKGKGKPLWQTCPESCGKCDAE